MTPLARSLVPYLSTTITKPEVASKVAEQVLSLTRWSRRLKPILTQTTIPDLSKKLVSTLTSSQDDETKMEIEVSKERAEIEKAMHNSFIKSAPSKGEPKLTDEFQGPLNFRNNFFENYLVQNVSPVSNVIQLITLGLVPPIRKTESNVIMMTLVYEILRDALTSDENMRLFVRQFGAFPSTQLLKIPANCFIYAREFGTSYETILRELIETGHALHARVEQGFSALELNTTNQGLEALSRALN